ncbi:MAG: glycosyltransferase family 4 protein, partial [Anaerolineales bacterium]
DILHAHRVNSAGWLAAASGFHPYVVTPWGSDVLIQPQRSWIARILARYTLQHADMVTTNSRVMGEQVIRLGARAETLRAVQFGVNLDVFNMNETINQEEMDLRKQLLLPEKARIVLSPRAVHPIYNLDIIIQAISLVRERIQDAYFIFIDYNSDPDYKMALDRRIKQLGVVNHVRWLPATRNRNELSNWYHHSDVVVSVPSSDGTPVTVLEAMACGKPVICTDLPSLREFITSGENGYLVPVRQVSPLAEAIIQLISQPDQAKEFSRKAHQLVAEKADFEVEMKRMETIYYQLAAEHRR